MAKFTIQSVFSAVDQLSGPVKTMRGQVNGFAKDAKSGFAGIGKSASAMKGLVVGAVAALTTGAAAKAINDFSERGDKLIKTARMLGVTSDALQELTYAAGMQGVETAQLENGLKLLNNQMGQLQTGSGSLYSALEKTSPALARQLRSVQSTDEAFTILMDTLSKETNVQKRAMIAQAAFGKSGQELIKFANGGTEAIAALRGEAHKYGLVIDKEALESSEAFNDSLSRLKQSGGALLNGVLAQAVTRLQPVIQGMADWVAANRTLIGQRIDQTIGAIATAAKIVGDAWNSGLIPAVLAGVGAFKAITTGIAIYQAVAATATAVQLALNGAMIANPVGLIVMGIAVAVGALVGAIILLVKNWDKVKAAMASAWDMMKAFGAWIASGFLTALRGVLGILDAMLAPFRAIIDTVMKVTGSDIRAPKLADMVPVSPNARGIESRSISESRSSLDVNFNNAPAGTSFAQRGSAPGITVNQFSTVRGL